MLTRGDVLRIAEEAGFGRLLPATGSIPACWHGQDIGRLEQFAAAAYAAGLAAEREARKAAQLETISLREELTKRAMQAEKDAYRRGVRDEREACAKVCDERAMKNENAAQEAESDEDATGLRAAAWQIGICAAAIRARGEVKS